MLSLKATYWGWVSQQIILGSTLVERLDLSSFINKTGLPKSNDSSVSNWVLTDPPPKKESKPPSLQKKNKEITPPPSPTPPLNVALSSFMPTLIALAKNISRELNQNLHQLISLNPSRRESLLGHLERLGDQTLNPRRKDPDSITSIRRWIEGPRTASENTALMTYLEEVSLICLGQALVLKSWSDQGVRIWGPHDLKHLNWTLSQCLKPHKPIHHEGWQITKPNLYSWYSPSQELQREIWVSLQGWSLKQEGPQLLIDLLTYAHRSGLKLRECQGYDLRFLSALWEMIEKEGLDSAARYNNQNFCSFLRRRPVIYSPTLRNGASVRTGPKSVDWVGLEENAFHLFIAELAQLWMGPVEPPLWTTGNGLEVHPREQITMNLSASRPTSFSQIADLASADIALVLEEKTVRSQEKDPESIRFRNQLECISFFKDLSSGNPSLATLQSCVSLTKLRPGGLLWWAREEPLGVKDGREAIKNLFQNGLLLASWDFSRVKHSLPLSTKLFPKFLYLFFREPKSEVRQSHRPLSLKIEGTIRSHIELPLFLEDALNARESSPISRGQWKIQKLPSPTPQLEWVDSWPDESNHETLGRLEHLRENSVPLGQMAIVRSVSNSKDFEHGHIFSDLPKESSGIRIQTEFSHGERRLVASRLNSKVDQKSSGGLVAILHEELWVAPVCFYLNSAIIHDWLELFIERRSGKWSLNDINIKYLPVPNSLVTALKAENHSKNESWLEAIGQGSKDSLPLIQKIEQTKDPKVRAEAFIQIARSMDRLDSSLSKLQNYITRSGHVRWSSFIQILPKNEILSFSLHPEIRISGNLSPFAPISKIRQTQSPSSGFILSTESGQTLHLFTSQPFIQQILWDQFRDLSHPTWNELTQWVLLPRQVELAQSTANEILSVHGEQLRKRTELAKALANCLII